MSNELTAIKVILSFCVFTQSIEGIESFENNPCINHADIIRY